MNCIALLTLTYFLNTPSIDSDFNEVEVKQYHYYNLQKAYDDAKTEMMFLGKLEKGSIMSVELTVYKKPFKCKSLR